MGTAWTCHLIATLSLPSVPPEDWVQSHPFPRGNKHTDRVLLAPTVLDTATVSFTTQPIAGVTLKILICSQSTGIQSGLGFGLDVVERTGVGLIQRFIYTRGTKGRE